MMNKFLPKRKKESEETSQTYYGYSMLNITTLYYIIITKLLQTQTNNTNTNTMLKLKTKNYTERKTEHKSKTAMLYK